jgi:hypothetical protein
MNQVKVNGFWDRVSHYWGQVLFFAFFYKIASDSCTLTFLSTKRRKSKATAAIKKQKTRPDSHWVERENRMVYSPKG